MTADIRTNFKYKQTHTWTCTYKHTHKNSKIYVTGSKLLYLFSLTADVLSHYLKIFITDSRLLTSHYLRFNPAMYFLTFLLVKRVKPEIMRG